MKLSRIALVLGTLAMFATTFGKITYKLRIGERWPWGLWLVLALAFATAWLVEKAHAPAAAVAACVLVPPIAGLLIAVGLDGHDGTYGPGEWHMQSYGLWTAAIVGAIDGVLAAGSIALRDDATRHRRFAGGWLCGVGVIAFVYALTRTDWYLPSEMIGANGTSQGSASLSGMRTISMIACAICVAAGISLVRRRSTPDDGH